MAQEFVSSRGERIRGQEVSSVVGSKTGERVIALYPGESGEIIVRIHGPRGHVVAVEEHGFPGSVASLEVMPRQAEAPFNSTVRVSVAPNAKPGVYPWSIVARDAAAGRLLGQEAIVLVVLPRRLPRNTARHITRLQRVYRKYGIQAALWTALRILYPGGARFTTIWELYQLLTQRRVSKGTVAGTLKVMARKGLLEKKEGLYKPLDLDPKVALSRVDLRRVRYPWQVLRPRETREQDREAGILERFRFSLVELPQPIRKAYTYAQRIAEKHGPLAALYFILYSLLGVRQTGYMLLWLSGWFIVLEPKTGFAHHFYSWLLHWMLEQLGLREGVYYKPHDREHVEAQRVAQQYIREIYGSHQSARRLHYMLWEKKLVWSDEDEVYTVRVYRYADGETGVQVLDKTGGEELYSEGLRDEPAAVEVYTALPVRHVDPRREETYHYRPAGMY